MVTPRGTAARPPPPVASQFTDARGSLSPRKELHAVFMHRLVCITPTLFIGM